MNISQEQYDRILARLNAIEERMNQVAIALDKFITLDQVAELMVLVQTDVDSIKSATNALENRVVSIESEPLED